MTILLANYTLPALPKLYITLSLFLAWVILVNSVWFILIGDYIFLRKNLVLYLQCSDHAIHCVAWCARLRTSTQSGLLVVYHCPAGGISLPGIPLHGCQDALARHLQQPEPDGLLGPVDAGVPWCCPAARAAARDRRRRLGDRLLRHRADTFQGGHGGGAADGARGRRVRPVEARRRPRHRRAGRARRRRRAPARRHPRPGPRGGHRPGAAAPAGPAEPQPGRPLVLVEARV